MRRFYYLDTDSFTYNFKSCMTGGIHKIPKFGKRHMKQLKNDYSKKFPKPFKSHKAFQRQKRGKR